MGDHKVLVVHMGTSMEGVEFHMAVVGTGLIFRSYMRSPRKWPRDMCCKGPYDTVLDTGVFHISAFDHIYGCICALLLHPRRRGEDGP